MKIIELKLNAENIGELKKFYTETLGVECVNSNPNSFTITAGTSKLTFLNNKTKDSPYYHFAFDIPENQIKEASVWLKERTSPIKDGDNEIIDFKNWNAHSIYFNDVAGNVVELTARHNKKNSSDKPFSFSNIINISEAGVPVNDVKKFYRELKEKTGEKLWSGNEETFAAVGDENGLLIVVPISRNWFPTDKASKIFPLTILAEGTANKMASFEGYPYRIILKEPLSSEGDNIELRGFINKENKITSLPSTFEKRKKVLEFYAEKFEKGKEYNQKEVNVIINENSAFNDPALIRRELCDGKLLSRNQDGSKYWKND